MAKVRRLVIDILKPHNPTVVDLTNQLAEMEGIEGVNSSLIEVDEDVKNFKITIEGEIKVDDVRTKIEESGGSIHSIDEVAAGKRLVEKVDTPQDHTC